MHKLHIFTDADLDGAGSLLLLKLAFPTAEITHNVVTHKTFREDLLKWLQNHSFNDYTNVFFCDLCVPEHCDLTDHKNVIIFDHHKDHVEAIDNYSEAKVVIKIYTSTTLLIYHSLKLSEKLSDNQKLLVKLIDDYDSYQLKIPYSKPLNFIFWHYTGNRTEKFIEEFSDGFFGFNHFQKNALKLVEKSVQRYFREETLYKGELTIGGKVYNVIGACFEDYPNEIAERALREYNGDFIILLNLNRRTTSYRRAPHCELDMSKVAAKLADGGGHEAAAGSPLNDNVINITKLLKPIQK